MIKPMLAVLGLAWTLAGHALGEDRVVYRSNFSQGATPSWTINRLSVTPKGDRRFLGMFGRRGTVSLRLPALPAHQLLRVRCTVFQIYSPDGNQPKDGPDFWGISLGGGPELLRTTFHFAHLWDPPNHPQSFPDEYPINHPAGTGAAELGTLGYRFEAVKIEPQASHSDMVYQIEVVFPHAEPNAEIQFWSDYNGALTDEAWGLESVEVEALPECAQRSEDEMQKLWAQMLADDPGRAATALWALAACGPAATEFAGKQMGGAAVRDQVVALVRDLSSDDIVKQEKARLAVDKLEPQALPALRQALAAPSTPAHLREEFAGLLADMKTESPLFISRVGHLLRVLNSPESRSLLATLTGTPAPGEVTGDFARLRWHGIHAMAEDPWCLRSAFTPDGKKLVTVSGDGARTWDVESGRPLTYCLALGGRSLAVSPDGELLSVGTKGSIFGVWNLASGKLVSVLRGHEGEGWGVGFLGGSQRLVTGAADGLRWWNVGEAASTDDAVLISATRYLAVAPNGKTIALAECDGDHDLVTFRDAATGKLTRKLPEFSDTITSLAYSHDGKLLAVTTYADGVGVFDVDNGRRRYHFDGLHPKSEGAAFSPDDHYLCIGGGGGEEASPEAQAERGVRLYRLEDQKEIWRITNVAKSCLSVAFSPDGKLVAGTDAARNVYLWEVVREK